jgi:CubicO group peptidase (beta-lactamase class C family)
MPTHPPVPHPVQGFVAPGFDRVRDAFAANFSRADAHRELGAALCVYKDGACVLDVWGGYADTAGTKPWQHDTLVNVWSTTKGVTAIALAMLADRGLIGYGQRVAEVWPEFAAAGKQDITIAQVLCHRAGLPGFEQLDSPTDIYDWDLCARRLAAQAPVFTPGSVSCYHTTTYGNLAGEILRRVTGRSIGTFVRDELAEPLDAEFHLGMPAALDGKVAEMVAPPPPPQAPDNDVPLPVRLAMGRPALDVGLTGTRAWRAAELPALNGQSNARGLARIFAMVANGGTSNGKRLMSPAGIAAMSTVGGTGDDLLVGFDPQWCMGVQRNPRGKYGSNPRTIGHGGWGGSFGCADVEGRIAIGYVCNRMGAGLQGDPRTDDIVTFF